MKLKIYLKADSAPVSTHYVKDKIQETESGSFVQFMTLTNKRITTNMDFIITDEDEEG